MKSLFLASALIGLAMPAYAACVAGNACPFTVGETAVLPNVVTADPHKVFAQQIFTPTTVNGNPISQVQLRLFHFYLASPPTPTSTVHLALYNTVITATGDDQPGTWLGGSLCMDTAGGNGACKPAKPCNDPNLCVTLVQGWNTVPPYIMHGAPTGEFWLAYKLDTGQPGTTQYTNGVTAGIEEYSEPVPSANNYVFVPNWQVVNGKPAVSVQDANHASFYADFVGVQ